MEITSETRLDIYRHATDKVQYFFGSSNTTDFLTSVIKRYFVENLEAQNILATTVGDIILGFYKMEDTIPLLEQELGLDSATAEKLGQEVLAFLAPLNDPNWEPPVEEDTDEDGAIESLAGESSSTMTFANSEAVSIPIQSTRIPIKAPAITAPPPLHTYAHDMEVVRHPEAFEDVVPVPTTPEPTVPAIPATPVEVPVAQTPSTPLPSFIHTAPTPVSTPAPTISTPTSTPEPMTARVPLEPLPSYTPPAVPIITPPTTAAPAPDRPRWSTDI